jgi:hypothetical protein
MSAHRYTDCRIDCDQPGCPRSEFASHLDLMDATAGNARKVLARRGWKVGVSDGHGITMDFCPEHAATPETP